MTMLLYGRYSPDRKHCKAILQEDEEPSSSVCCQLGVLVLLGIFGFRLIQYCHSMLYDGIENTLIKFVGSI